MPAETRTRVKAAAAARGQSVQDLVGGLIDRFLAEADRQPPVLPETDRRTYRAIKNGFAEIGEAIKRLPPESLARHRGIDWRGFAGLRDMVSHRYFGLGLPRLWPTIREELPALLATVDEALARLASGRR